MFLLSTQSPQCIVCYSIIAVLFLYILTFLPSCWIVSKPTTTRIFNVLNGKDRISKQPLVKKYAAILSNNDDNNEEIKRVLNVHVVPHTHDDVGWLKTVEQYYYGYNNTIQSVCVDDILTTVVEALLENPSRTFTYVEQKFFTMWWEQQTESIKQSMKQLIANGQFTFVNGGWCMHDEAATHYMGMIDQTTLGHSFLQKEFGVIPKVGWQLDPFGHSATQASLLSYKMGFDALYFGRIDYQDLSKRHLTQECEGIWNASNSWKDSSIFWGLTGSYNGNYGPPTGFCFDIHCQDPSLLAMNRTTLIRAVEDFLLQVRQQSDRTKGNHIMLTMGSDFQYQRASVNFANTDFLLGTIHHLQEWDNAKKELDIPAMFGPRFDKVNIFYSSPDYYTQCKYNETRNSRRAPHLPSLDDQDITASTTYSHGTTNDTDTSLKDEIIWTVKQDDFFPYSDCPNCFWTGYFTSRPALKRFERVASSFLLAARQLEAMLDFNGSLDKMQCKDPMKQLEDASGVIQHHDGVSGTSKQHVAYDYAKRLQAGINAVVPCTIQKVKRLLLGDKADTALHDLTYCQLLNETKCDVSIRATSQGQNKIIYLVIYNSLPWDRSSFIHLPVASKGQYILKENQNNGTEEADWRRIVSAHEAPFHSSIIGSDGHETQGLPYVLSFEAESLPPLGAKVFSIEKASSSTKLASPDSSQTFLEIESDRTSTFMNISNGVYSVQVDTMTGNIVRLGSSEVKNLTVWGYYTSFDLQIDKIRDSDNQNSGAYIFRPSTPDQQLQTISAIDARIINSSIGVEVHVTYEVPWIQTTTRILKNVPYLEIEYQVGPIPLDDGRGKEIVTRYNTLVNNAGTFHTDSNGREFLKRKLNSRPSWDLTVYEPVAGNYYPVNAAMYVETPDGTSKESTSSFAVVTDRTQGGTSLYDSTLEVMVHRRTIVDDRRGVSEPINETDIGITPNPPFGNATRLGRGLVIRGKHRLLIASSYKVGHGTHSGASLARSSMDDVFAEPLVFVGSSDVEVPFRSKSFSGLKESLPKNIMLITKKLLHDENETTYLIRLGHQYGLDEHPELSKPTQVSLDPLFPDQTIQQVQETTLSGNTRLSAWSQQRMDWTGTKHSDTASLDFNAVTLHPMDIRTFLVTVRDSFMQKEESSE